MKKIILTTIISLISISGNAFADIRERESRRDDTEEIINAKIAHPFTMSAGLESFIGLLHLSPNYNFTNNFSANASFKWVLQSNTVEISFNPRFYLWDISPALSFYTQSNIGLIAGSKTINQSIINFPGTTPNPGTTVGYTDPLLAQKIGLEYRNYNGGFTSNFAWGVFYQFSDTRGEFLPLFKNSFVPLAFDFTVGYAF